MDLPTNKPHSALRTPHSALRTPQSNLPLALMLLVLGVYILTMSGHTYSPDEETMLETSRTLVEKGTWAITPSRSLVEVEGADGRMYSQYGPGQPLATVPWVAVGSVVGGFFPKDQAGFPLRLILGTYNALMAAGLVGLFAAIGLALGYSRRASVLAAGALAFATFLWPHSRTFFSEPLVALSLFASFYLLFVSYRRIGPGLSQRRAWLPVVLSGALFALAIATKAQYVVALPAFLLYLTWRFIETRRQVPNPQSAIEAPPGPPQSAMEVPPGPPQSKIQNPKSKIPVYWLFGLAAGALPLLLYNQLVFGSAFTTGYGSDAGALLKTLLYEGAFGLLLSPGKGLLWYALPLALTLWGWPHFARRHGAETAFIVVLALPVLILFSLYNFWPGDGSWGPRYLIPILPFLFLPVLPVLDGIRDQGSGIRDQGSGIRDQGSGAGNPQMPETPQSSVLRPSSFVFRLSSFVPQIAVSSLIALGLLVNALGAVANFDTYINMGNDDDTRYWFPYASPIVGHLNLFNHRVHEWTLRAFPQPGATLFTGGFSYSEGNKIRGDVLPRWTTGSGVMQVYPPANGILSMTLRLTDHRPADMPRAKVSVLVDGKPAALEAAPVKDTPISTDYSFSIEGKPTTVTIQTDTWNPSKVQGGPRNEDIGIKLDSISLAQGEHKIANELVEDLPAPPYYPQPRWYYDPGTHHPADVWAAYLAETGMGRRAMLALGLPVMGLALLCIVLGWRGLITRRLRSLNTYPSTN